MTSGRWTSREILDEGIAILLSDPEMATPQNVTNIQMAAALTWQREEMGGIEYLQFAYRNDTPIVPLGHECHPLELVKRGFVDGEGWPADAGKPNIKLSKWPDGKHWYAYVDGEQVIEGDCEKWNTPQQAEAAAKRFAESRQ